MGNKNSSKNPKESSGESSKSTQINTFPKLVTSDSSSSSIRQNNVLSSRPTARITPKLFEQAASGYSSTDYRTSSTYLPPDSTKTLTSSHLNDTSRVASRPTSNYQGGSTTLRNAVDVSRRSALSDASRVTDSSSQRVSATLTLRNGGYVSPAHRSLNLDQKSTPKPLSAVKEEVRPGTIPTSVQHSIQAVPKPNPENNQSLTNSKETFGLYPSLPQSSSCNSLLQNSYSTNYTSQVPVTDSSSQRVPTTLNLRNACDVNHRSLIFDPTLTPKPLSTVKELVRPGNVPTSLQHSIQAVSKPNPENSQSFINSKKPLELTPSLPQSFSCNSLLQNSHSAADYTNTRKVELNSTAISLRNLSYANRNSSNFDSRGMTTPNDSAKHHSYGNLNQSKQSTVEDSSHSLADSDLRMLKLLNIRPKPNLLNVGEENYSPNDRGRPRGGRRTGNNNTRRRQGNERRNKRERGSSFDNFNDDNDVYSADNAGRSKNESNNAQQNRRGGNFNQFRGRGQSSGSSNNQGGSTRGSENNRGGRRETIEETLQKLVAMEGNEIVFRLQFDVHDLNQLLRKVSKFNHTFPVFIEILYKVCESQFYQNNVTEALTLLLNSEFPEILTKYLASTPLQTLLPVNWTTFFNHILHIFQKYFRLFPHNASEVFGVALSVAINTVDILTKKMTVDANILKELRVVDALRIENLAKFDKPTQVKISRDELMHSKQPPNNFRHVATVLCLEDVHQMADSFLRSNITKGSYNDVEHYLDVQFRLLREDFVAPLREGIIEYITLLRRNEGKDIKLRDLKIYNNVHLYMIDKIPFVGIVHVIKFDVSKLKAIRWEQTKRFLNGSLVCLSSDGFQNFRLAIIAKRDPVQLAKGYVGVKFLQNGILEVDVNETFVMVESPTYFEAYHPVLEGLKNIMEDAMPFVNNIVKADGKINPPSYLNRLSRYDLTCIASDTAIRKNCYPLISTSWPSTSDLNLDESQHKALEAALTREIAVIQGPPGTGKTFLGLRIVQVLLNNKNAWSENGNSPILIVCYTNHALDQFLEEIKKFLSDGIVRVGGQSKSDELKALNINNLKRNMQENRKVPNVVHKSRMELGRELRSIGNEIENYQVELKKGVETVLSETILSSQGIITEEHLTQLNRLKTDNCGHALTKSTAIKIWLGLDGISFNKIEVNDNPQEQLRNLVENLETDDKSDDQDVDDSEVEDVLAEEEMANRIEEEDWMIDDPWVANPKQKAKNTRVENKDEEFEEHKDPFEKWEITKDQKKRLKQKMKTELIKSDYMNEAEVARIKNVLALDNDERWRLYRYWIYKLRELKLNKLESLQTEYEKSCEQLKEANEFFDKEILKNATIIGMTTTGAAKHRSTLQQVQPAIVIVEEAAEVLETHIVTALSKNCKHLVLIGDQQQLRPNPTVYKLAKDYNLDVSLFERLINNGLPYERLTSQHRMRPEIATLLVPHIYDHLQNHPSVEKYENIGGMRKNVFFLNHQNNEASLNDSKSKSNAFEAGMIIALARYLLLQGYLPSQMTILSTYLGQVFLIKQLTKNTIVKDVRCTVVDNFQGEENDIILLSLVRSNDEGIVGFLKVENRVCVALSRAKKGLFCIGNLNLLGSKAPIWKPIIKKLLDNNAIESGFPLVCQNHPTTTFDAGSVKDFEKVPEGGCLLPCEYRLPCGHSCEKVCHIIDREHTKIKCLKPCSKILCSKGHKCPKICSNPCGRCTAKVEKRSPCLHFNTMPCYVDPVDFCCTQPCNKILPCNHKCSGYCGSLCDITKCNVLVNAISSCGHTVVISCNLSRNDKALLKVCKKPCETILSCEHLCKGSCYDCKQMRIHLPCQEKCGRTLVCGHSCNVPCAETCPPCEQNCENRCIHSKCPKTCGDPCEPCREPCAWQCPHKTCSKLCHEFCDREPCSEPCPVVLKCGHSCIGHCGEPCSTKCRVCDKDEVCEVFFGEEDEDDSKFVLIEDCNHVVESRGMDTWMNTDTESGSEINMKSCPKCKTIIRKSLRYGNIVKTMQNDVISVKRKIMKEHKNLKRETKKAKETAANAIPQLYMFTLAKDMILNQLEYKNLSSFDVNLLNNKVKFLLKMSNMWQCERATRMFDIVKENLKDLEEILVQLVHKSAAETALKEFAQELVRVEWLRKIIISVQDKVLNAEAKKCFNELYLILTNKQPFTVKQEEIVGAMMKKLNQLQTGLGITNVEKMEIIRALGLGSGHWFKCPNGHIYAIGDCGGAMERGKCPECGSGIGGEHHRLTGDNQLASEMDGATAPAYPTMRRNRF